MKRNYLNDIEGIRGRRQYFNLPIYIFLVGFLISVEICTLIPLFEGNFEPNTWLEDIYTGTVTIAILILPFLLLSVFNRFFFGKIVCVLNDEGLHFKDGLIRWNDIVCLKYSATCLSQRHFRVAYVEVACKNENIKIKSAPLYVMSAVKRFNPNIKTKTDKSVLWIVAVVIIIGAIVSAI